jgi:hypothetical protein
MKIVRVRISGWAIKDAKGLWLCSASIFGSVWAQHQQLAFVFKRLSEAEKWVAENN